MDLKVVLAEGRIATVAALCPREQALLAKFADAPQLGRFMEMLAQANLADPREVPARVYQFLG
jgi:hypothetical protein